MRLVKIFGFVVLFLAAIVSANAQDAATKPLYVKGPADLVSGAGFALAMQELSIALEEIHSPLRPMLYHTGAKVMGEHIVLRLSERQIDAPPEWKAWSGDGFRIISRGRTTVIESSQPRGLLYGLFYLARRVQLDGHLPNNVRINRKPAFTFRMATDTPEAALRLGYNMIPLKQRPAEVCLLDQIQPPLYTGEARSAALERVKKMTLAVNRARDYELEPIASGDEFELPSAVLREDLLPQLTCKGFDSEQLEFGMGLGNIFCFARPRLWDLLDAKYQELFERFPAIPGVMVRLGENRSRETGEHLVGSGVYAYSRPMYCETCREYNYDDRLSGAIRCLYHSIVEKNDRLYIHRTWDISDTLLHSNPDIFQRLVWRLPQDPRLMISTKYTTSDFWRYNPLNPTFKIVSKQPRMVEVQCTREYEGKGAYPNFIGDELQPILQQLVDKKVVGVWSWHHGGGQGGPHVQIDFWNQANAYLVSELAWQPDRSAQDIALEWATLSVGKEAAKPLADLLLESDDTILALRYFEAYSSKHQGWTPANLWLRDDKIRGSRNLSPIYTDAAESVDEMIDEKERAVKQVEKSIKLLQRAKAKCRKERIRCFCSSDFSSWQSVGPISIRSGVLEQAWISRDDFFTALESSLNYELALAKLLHEYCSAYFIGRRWIDEGRSRDQKQALKAIERWKEAWTDYQQVSTQLPYAPSLYQDDGMVATMEWLERTLNEGREPAFQWWVIGPFDNANKQGFERSYPPEKEVNLRRGCAGLDGEVQWRVFPPENCYDGYYDLDASLDPNEWVVAYTWTSFFSEQGGQAMLHAGSDDGLIVWLNGEKVISEDAYRAALPEQHLIPVQIKAGKNEILLKVTEGILGWGYYLRLTDAEGKPVTGIQPIVLEQD